MRITKDYDTAANYWVADKVAGVDTRSQRTVNAMLSDLLRSYINHSTCSKLYEINLRPSRKNAPNDGAKESMHSDDCPPDADEQNDDSALARVYAAARLSLPQPVMAHALQQPIEIIQLSAELRRLELRTPTLPPATHTGCYVIGPTDGPGEICLVDPGSPYRDQQEALDRWLAHEQAQGRNLRCVLLTHHHGDHIGGAAHLATQGIPIWAHHATRDLVSRRVAVTQLLDDTELFTIADTTIQAIWTPGHARGHLCFALAGAAVTEIIAGDMVAGVGTILIDPDEGTMIDYLASLTALVMLGPSRLHPAHGPVIVDGVNRLQQYLAHRLMRENQIIAALTTLQAASAADLVALAYADTPKLLWPLAQRSLLAHLGKLRTEGRASDGPTGVWRAC